MANAEQLPSGHQGRPMRSLLLLLMFLMVVHVRATHIIGGEMYYDHLGGNQYRITLDLYRDCGPDNENGTGFDFSAQLGVFNSAGVLLFTQDISDPGETIVPVDLDDPCLAAPPEVCVATTRYEAILNLPPINGGYVIAYQRCCRTPALVNLQGQQGLTSTIQVPSPPNAVNSSPRFNAYPPVALCLGRDMVIDQSATDPDGDELVYSLCAPYQGADAIQPMPQPPTAPPYPFVNYAAGYSATSPINSAPPIAIDAATGTITVHPTLQGAFTVGVCVAEYRNGELLSTVRRDFMFKVVVCDVTIISSIQEQDDICSGLTQTFEHESINGTFWYWDFGDPATLADTSSEASPQWTYTTPGLYTVTLIANPGWPCADTSTSVFSVFPVLDVSFDRPPIRCPGEVAALAAEGVFGADVVFTWDLGPFASPPTAAGSSVNAGFSEPGVHAVTLFAEENGCSDSYTDSVVVFPRPVVDFVNDPNGCVGEELTFASLATAWTPLQYLWSVGDGTTSQDSSFIHAYTAPGLYPVALTVATDSGCIATVTLARPGAAEIFPNPIAAFTALPTEVSLMDPVVEIVDYSASATELEYTVQDLVTSTPDFIYEFTDGGQFLITQTVMSGEGCVDSTSRTVTVSDHLIYVPNAFTPDGDGLNDQWAPSVRGARLYDLVVFDRWGQEVFRSTDPKAAWDGSGYPQGVYNYTIRLAEFGAYRAEYTGHFTLLR
jgi:gliding motility-associated-like protein